MVIDGFAYLRYSQGIFLMKSLVLTESFVCLRFHLLIYSHVTFPNILSYILPLIFIFSVSKECNVVTGKSVFFNVLSFISKQC